MDRRFLLSLYSCLIGVILKRKHFSFVYFHTVSNQVCITIHLEPVLDVFEKTFTTMKEPICDKEKKLSLIKQVIKNCGDWNGRRSNKKRKLGGTGEKITQFIVIFDPEDKKRSRIRHMVQSDVVRKLRLFSPFLLVYSSRISSIQRPTGHFRNFHLTLRTWATDDSSPMGFLDSGTV